MKGVPIKFRAWCAELGKFVYMVGSSSFILYDNEIYFSDQYDDHYKIKTENMDQLCGYDADGNEVYEGDKLYYYRCSCVSGDYIRQNKIPPAGVCTVISAHRLDGLYDVGLNDHFDYEFLLKKFNKEKD